MSIAFYIASTVAVLATAVALTRAHAVHALLFLIVSLLAVAVDFFVLGAPFVAALEVIIYAGAIMVLFLFVVMLLGLDRSAVARERAWMSAGQWAGAGLLAAVLLGELGYLLAQGAWSAPSGDAAPSVAGVASALYGPYVLAVELASMLLLAGLVGAFHLGRPDNAAERGTLEDARGEPLPDDGPGGEPPRHPRREAA